MSVVIGPGLSIWYLRLSILHRHLGPMDLAELVKVDVDDVMAPAQDPKSKQARTGPTGDQMMKLVSSVAKLALSNALASRVLRAAVMHQYIINKNHIIVQ